MEKNPLSFENLLLFLGLRVLNNQLIIQKEENPKYGPLHDGHSTVVRENTMIGGLTHGKNDVDIQNIMKKIPNYEDILTNLMDRLARENDFHEFFKDYSWLSK